MSETCDVVVVGGGAVGLAAAMALSADPHLRFEWWRPRTAWRPTRPATTAA